MEKDNVLIIIMKEYLIDKKVIILEMKQIKSHLL